VFVPLIRPFAGLRPTPEYTAQVIAPPYDVVTAEEARERAAGKPWSFLHISRPEIDLPPDTDPYAPVVYAKGKENFLRLIKQEVLRGDPGPYYYLYRLIMGTHIQTGLVAVASIEAYQTNRIKKHELTRPDKVDDRVRQIDVLNAQTGPVFLTYPHSEKVDDVAASIATHPPDVDVTADDDVRHRLWVIRDRQKIDLLSKTFEGIRCLYIADGHHRSAAASRVAESRRARNNKHTGDESYNYFLSVIFPDNQMRILSYDRVIKDLKGLSRGAFLKKLNTAFDVKPEDQPVQPNRGGEFGMYLAGQWYRLIIHAGGVPSKDPVKRLDVSLLTDHVISPVLGVADTRRDQRIDFIGGIRGLKELERLVDSGEMAVAFSMFPTALADLMAVADAGQAMPPKSTWFEPKLADGLVSHVLD
jgi:uncharacterized protein (DUF1015 family)